MGRRMEITETHAAAADKIYRSIFPYIADGCEIVNVTAEEAMGRYDWKEGIDVILYASTGEKIGTLQEKFLTYPFRSTVTFEEEKQSGKKGAWYNCSAGFYFVGYTRKYWDWKGKKRFESPEIGFQDWILLNLPSFRMEHNLGHIQWQMGKNKSEGRTNPFRYIDFNNVPDHCVVSRFRE